MQIAVHNQEGKEVKKIDLNEAVFAVQPKQDVVHQVFTAMNANARKVLANTKGRGEVRGGGKKPWGQKGTGRARHSSIRSPIWRGGGITFGPTKERNFEQKINKKMRRLAIRMCLSDKVIEQHFIVIDSLATKEAKTKQFATMLSKFPVVKGRTLLVLTGGDNAQMIRRSGRNIPRVHFGRPEDVNVIDLLNNQFVITTPEGVEKITATFAK